VLTADHLLEYKKQFFVGPKVNFTVCTARDLSVQSPVKEFWNTKYIYRFIERIDVMAEIRNSLLPLVEEVWEWGSG
ncbi:hypothetical protein TELCIR_22417, partial [Teladorsagia circumcincta]